MTRPWGGAGQVLEGTLSWEMLGKEHNPSPHPLASMGLCPQVPVGHSGKWLRMSQEGVRAGIMGGA